MVWLIKTIVIVGGLGLIGLAGYAYLADLSPPPRQITVPVTLND